MSGGVYREPAGRDPEPKPEIYLVVRKRAALTYFGKAIFEVVNNFSGERGQEKADLWLQLFLSRYSCQDEYFIWTEAEYIGMTGQRWR